MYIFCNLPYSLCKSDLTIHSGYQVRWGIS
jgi:hypothetical protein